MSERRVNVVLSPDLAAIWRRLVEDGRTDEEVLKRLILMAPPSRQDRLKSAPLEKPFVMLGFGISARDAALARKMAQASGFSLSGWLRSLVVARLRRRPQYPSEELRIHSVLRYEIQRIGSTMRAAAQSLNPDHPNEVQDLLEAYGDARRHLLALRAAIAGSLLYWEVADE